MEHAILEIKRYGASQALAARDLVWYHAGSV
jgi:hypothetical protein